MKYAPLDVPASYPIAAIYKNTEPDQTAPWVMPGTFTARLTVDGKTFDQTFTVKIDPRVKTSAADLQKQHDLSLQSYEARSVCLKTLKEISQYRAMLHSQLTNAPVTAAEKLGAMEKEAGQLENTAPGSSEPSFGRLTSSFTAVFNVLQDSDRAPTAQAMAAYNEAKQQLQTLQSKWVALKNK